jgi:hypothetical protein
MNKLEGVRREVEKKDATGLSRMVHAVWQQRQLRLVKVFLSTYSEFTLKYIIASGYFADFFSSCCLLSPCSRLEVFNKVMRASWTWNFL